MESEIELTELIDLEVERQDGVANPASGFRFLIQKEAAEPAAKDVNAVGGINEAPDIAGAERVLTELYNLIAAEAREGAVGAHEEADIATLVEAVSLVCYFKHCEEMGAGEDDGNDLPGVSKEALLEELEVCKAHRKFSSDERKRLASEGKALPDGSYPIPDADALRRAAILARSGHGDVAAAKRLIARRAKELGVPNPLADDAKKDEMETTEETVAPEATVTETVTKEAFDALAERVEKMESAKAEAEKRAEEAEGREAATKAELEALKRTPIPGGPALSAPTEAKAYKEKQEALAKSAYHKRQAALTNDRELIAYHTAQAAKFEAEAK